MCSDLTDKVRNALILLYAIVISLTAVFIHYHYRVIGDIRFYDLIPPDSPSTVGVLVGGEVCDLLHRSLYVEFRAIHAQIPKVVVVVLSVHYRHDVPYHLHGTIGIELVVRTSFLSARIRAPTDTNSICVHKAYIKGVRIIFAIP